MRRTREPLLHGGAEQARCSAKEKQDVPDGERPDIHTQLFSSWVRPSGRTRFLCFKIKIIMEFASSLCAKIILGLIGGV